MFHFAAAAELFIFAGAGVGTFVMGWKKARARKHVAILPAADKSHLIGLQSQFGYNEHSFVGLAVQSEVWTDRMLNGAVSYSEHGNVWIVAGEPLGRDEDLSAITGNFIRHARGRRKVVAFLPATDRFARSISSLNLRTVKVGASPYFDLRYWDPRGNPAKKLRLGVNRAKRAGLSVEEVTILTDEFRREVAALTSRWLENRRAGVSFGWIFQLIPFQNAAAKKYFAARDEDGKLVGLLAASPIPARDGWYLEDVLRTPDAPDGTSDLLVFETLKMLAAQGAKLATLGTVPLSDKGCDGVSVGNNFVVTKALKASRKHLNSFYNFEGLGQFKSKFVPTWWESEYVVVTRGYLIPPRVVNAVLNIAVPGGLVKVGRILLAPVPRPGPNDSV